MKLSIQATIVAACALGMTAAIAQTVQRGETTALKGPQTVAQASTVAPIQTAQVGAAAGGAAGGASTAGGFVAGIGTAGTVGSTVVFVGSAVAATAAASGGDASGVAAVSH
jgi:hypothetical protein